LAAAKFAAQSSIHFASPEFSDAIQEVYESTMITDRGLRDIILQMFRSHPELELRKDVEEVLKETPEFAFELLRVARGIPVC
jgi:hypothetical protein